MVGIRLRGWGSGFENSEFGSCGFELQVFGFVGVGLGVERCIVSDFGFSGAGCRAWLLGFIVSGFMFRFSGSGLQFSGSCLRVRSLVFRVHGLGSGV